MNDDSARRAINWFELDRLVDGQLAPQEYRELLRQIDKDPDGWRQCAMAFLQHQAMEKEFQTFSKSPENPMDRRAKPAATPPIYVRQLSRSMKVLCGIAAALVLGVSAGVALRPVEDSGSIDSQVVGSVMQVAQEGGANLDPAGLNLNKASAFIRSSVAPLPGKSSCSRSSNDLHEVCEGVAEQDPYLSPCARPRYPFERKR